ncbi:MAG: 50S ribosomal protein L3 [Verrucomicrobia bacterium]|nr:50S ribosomal protein L3 [Verrucomicrobiota bacterium]
MTLKLMGKKRGMTRLFDESGNHIVCTVISAEPNVITQVKRKDTDGYEAVQLSAFKVKPSKTRNVTKPLKGHFAKANVEPRDKSAETRVASAEEFQLGQEVSVAQFAEIPYVDIQGVSKGKGHQGVIKRHHFAGGPASHGSGFHRHGGSTGMRSSPGRCLPGQKKSGRMGGDTVTLQNLRVVKIDEEKQVIIVEGAVPGARGGLVYITKAKKKISQKSQKKK